MIYRYLSKNQLTSLEVGIFDKNTALQYMCVDQGILSAVEGGGAIIGECDFAMKEARARLGRQEPLHRAKLPTLHLSI